MKILSNIYEVRQRVQDDRFEVGRGAGGSWCDLFVFVVPRKATQIPERVCTTGLSTTLKGSVVYADISHSGDRLFTSFTLSEFSGPCAGFPGQVLA